MGGGGGLAWVVVSFARGEPCGGSRASKDAIVWLGQKQHSSYDKTHANTLNASMSSVAFMYDMVRDADVLVWHEGDLSRRDADALEGKTNVRWCRLSGESWGPPATQKGISPARDGRWSLGYLSMIRWYAITCWDVLSRMGYEWVMRFDDDSFLLSRIEYNVFGRMREVGAEYGFRTIARECDRTFGEFVDRYVEGFAVLQDQLLDDGTIFCDRFPKHCENSRRPRNIVQPKRYCDGPGRLGFYNNWFVTRINFWTSPALRRFRDHFDQSALVFTHRANDLIFQTAAARLHLDRGKWLRFADWTYQHHTIRDGAVVWGGIETGYDDLDALKTLDAYLRRWHPPESLSTSDRVRVCRVQLSRNDSRFHRIHFIPHGRTRWNWLAAPYCNKNGRVPIW